MDASASSSVYYIMAPQFSRHLAEKSERYSCCCVAGSEFPKHPMLMNELATMVTCSTGHGGKLFKFCISSNIYLSAAWPWLL